MAEQIDGIKIDETPELQKAIEAASSADELKEILHAAAAKQGITAEAAAPAKAETKVEESQTEEADAKDSYYDEVVIGGKSYRFEGDSPADILRQIKAATAAHEAATAPAAKETKESPEDKKAALELEYRMG